MIFLLTVLHESVLWGIFAQLWTSLEPPDLIAELMEALGQRSQFPKDNYVHFYISQERLVFFIHN